MPDADYDQARGHAERVFSKAGVPTRWIRCASRPGETGDPGCKGIITPTDLVLRILPEAMASKVPVTGKAFGYAVPSRDTRFGTVANVFHHRIGELIARMRQRAGGRLYSEAAVLGHIMAHELGHILLGRGSHSRSGIMVFPWGTKAVEGLLGWRAVVLESASGEDSRSGSKAAAGARDKLRACPDFGQGQTRVFVATGAGRFVAESLS